mmetsp:Transcript_89633/g.254086  ORF Transcript_89633/g.254086 Transcript_89633/m.254086 type:complete len:205 (-) Transcript_89633:132-746(-)
MVKSSASWSRGWSCSIVMPQGSCTGMLVRPPAKRMRFLAHSSFGLSVRMNRALGKARKRSTKSSVYGVSTTASIPLGTSVKSNSRRYGMHLDASVKSVYLMWPQKGQYSLLGMGVWWSCATVSPSWVSAVVRLLVPVLPEPAPMTRRLLDVFRTVPGCDRIDLPKPGRTASSLSAYMPTQRRNLSSPSTGSASRAAVCTSTAGV